MDTHAAIAMMKAFDYPVSDYEIDPILLWDTWAILELKKLELVSWLGKVEHNVPLCRRVGCELTKIEFIKTDPE